MRMSNLMDKNRLGFLTIATDPSQARIGGLLLVNASGRPLEFHCTAAVKPNRAQEILYGPTLGEYLCGEQIGMALCDAIKHHPSLMLTDIPEVLALRPMVEFPLLMVVTEKNKQQKLPSQVVQSTQGENTVCVRTAYEKDLLAVEAILQGMAAVLDLEEPFGRIHEAISEAQGGIRKQKVA
jgi:hypothetical protein